ncbi:MAG: amino acid racemase [Woeseiaceae bacterium]|nr:amino acid racemase [Woeseiaceae bacterium]
MNDTLRTAGVLGGMGPAATVDFLARVLALTDASSDQQHIRLLVDQNPRVPDRQEALLRNARSPGPVLARMAQNLQSIGADFIVMPCNTAHAFQDDIIAAIDVPFVSIVDVTLAALPDGACAGLLTTRGCLDAGVFQPALAALGLDHRLPTPAQADALTRFAFDIKAGRRGADIASGVREICEQLIGDGATALVVACTELPLVLAADDFTVPLVSSTEELAKKTVRLARGEDAL